MSSEKNKVLKLMPYAIYVDIECLVKIIDCCKINPQIFSSAELGEHIPCRYLLSTILGYDHIGIRL